MCETLFKMFSQTSSLTKDIAKQLIDLENLVELIQIESDEQLDTFSVVKKIKEFILENDISEEHFARKILHTSLLTYHNLVYYANKWSRLNTIFKFYYKQASLLFNNPIETKKLVDQAHQNDTGDYDTDKNKNFIFYDISQIEPTRNSEVIIERTILRLHANGLNRKILCDAVLGIPLNTLSFFCKKARNWAEQSDYAKETVMRMQCWLNDPSGVDKLMEWKKSHYTSRNFLLFLNQF